MPHLLPEFAPKNPSTRQASTRVPTTLSEGVLRVGAFPGFAPFAWRNGAGAGGTDIDLLRRFARSQGWELSVQWLGFDRIWEAPLRGAVDVAASGLSLLPRHRMASVYWSKPYASVRRSLLIRQGDSTRFRDMGDFRQSRLAVVPASAAQGHAERTLPATATLTFCATLEDGITDLLAGRIDAVGTGDLSARHHCSQRRGLAALDVHGSGPPEHLSFAVRPSGGLLDKLNTFLGPLAGTS